MKRYDYIIVGAGIIGLSIARALKSKNLSSKILILDKEKDIAYHASGRNSGVLHAGFYYTADSLKAKFTVDGNNALKQYCREKNLALNECGKLVVATNEEELQQLYELEKRGKQNGSTVKIISEEEASKIEPNIHTFKKALWSPNTATIDPVEVCHSLKTDLKQEGVEFEFSSAYTGHTNNILHTNGEDFEFIKLINCAGVYADKIAHEFALGQQYTLIPFKGIYLKYTKNKTDIKTNIYPVPNLKNPFLGTHFTKTVTGDIKIGPTAMPAFWRENYEALSGFSFKELCQLVMFESKLLMKNSFGFRDLAQEEMKKYDRFYLIKQAAKMVQHIDRRGFTEYTKPGIRAQLLNKETLELVQDFLIEQDKDSVHILNAVSPAFTCSFPFAEHVVSQLP